MDFFFKFVLQQLKLTKAFKSVNKNEGGPLEGDGDDAHEGCRQNDAPKEHRDGEENEGVVPSRHTSVLEGVCVYLSLSLLNTHTHTKRAF